MPDADGIDLPQVAGAPLSTILESVSGPQRTPRLLIVDDEADILGLLSDVFEDQGYVVATAASGEAALALAAAFLPDLALIDLILPDLSGYEVIKRLGEIAPDLRSIMMTGHPSVENIIPAVDLRVPAFVIKPLDLPTVVGKLRDVADQQRLERENRALLDIVQVAYEQMAELYKHEHQIAEMLQHALLPTLPPRFGPFEVGDYYRVGVSETQVGGDVFDLISLPDGKIAILIADVSGKGLSAAVQMGMVRHSARALALVSNDPGLVVGKLDQVIRGDQEFAGFVTLFYGVFDPEHNLLRYVNAGHEPPLMYRAAPAEVVMLDSTAPVLGVEEFGEITFEPREHHFERGDVALLFTDGLSEIRRSDGSLVVDSLPVWLPEEVTHPAAEVATEVFRRARDAAASVLRDDLAIMVLKHVGA